MTSWSVRGNTLVVFTTLSLFTASFAASSLSATQTQRVVAAEVANTRAAADPALQILVTIQLNNVTVRQAIDALAQHAGVQVQYRDAIFESRNKRVTLRADRMPLRTALDRVLAGTQLSVATPVPGFLTIQDNRELQQATQGIVTGKVLHAKTRQPIPSAMVAIGNTGKAVAVNADGTFRIPAELGEQTLVIRAVGFTRLAKQVVVAADQGALVECLLEPSTSVLDEVIVTGTVVATARREIATPITVITAEEIAKRNITRIEQFFRGEVPGVLALDMGSRSYDPYMGESQLSQVYSRGTSDLTGATNPLKTYVDGVEIYDSQYLGTIDMQSIERIEIITGPQAATIYGSGAMGGVMQIFTKKGTVGAKPEVRLTVRYGMLENSLSNGRTPTHNDVLSVNGGSGSAFSYSSNLSYNYSGQWQPLLYSRAGGFSVGATHTVGRFTANGNIGVNMQNNGTATMPPGLRERYTSGERWNFGSTTTSDLQQISKTLSQNISLNVSYQATRIWSHSLVLGRSANAFRIVPLAPQFGTPSDTTVTHQRRNGSRTTWGYTSSVVPPALRFLTSTVSYGVNGSMREGLSLRGGSHTAQGGALVSPMASVEPDVEGWGGFGTMRLGIFRQLYFTIGMRLENNPDYGKNVKFDFTPTNGLAWTIERGDVTLKLQGSYGQATRLPAQVPQNVDNWSLFVGHEPWFVQQNRYNANLTPEYTSGPQGGFELFYGNRGSLALNFYRERVTDLVQRIPNVDSTLVKRLDNNTERYYYMFEYQNVATMKKQGIESTMSLNLGPFSARGTYSWNDSRVLYVNPKTLSQFGWYSGMSLPGIPTHTAHFNIGYAHGRASINLMTNYVGSINKAGQYHPLNFNTQFDREWMYRTGFSPRTTATWWYTQAGYSKSDLAMLYTINAWSTMSVNVTNVGNSYGSEQNEAIFYPTLGRQTVIGMTVRFPRQR